MFLFHRKYKYLVFFIALLQLRCNTLLQLFSEPFYVHEYHLENGLSVYLSVNSNEPVVKTSILVNAGSANDPNDATGLAHYLEHLMFKGTSQIGTTDYLREKPLLDQIENLYEDYRQTTNETQRKHIYSNIDKLSLEAAKFVIPNEFSRIQSLMGIFHSNAFTSNDRTYYVATVPANQIKNFLRLEWERFKDPVFRTFHTELESVFEERNLRVTNVQSNLFKQYFKIMFPSHPYGEKIPIGTDEHLKNPSLKKIQTFYKEHYIPSKMAICMSGDINPKEVLEEIKKTFGTIPSKMEPIQLKIPEHKPQESTNQIVLNSKKKIYLFGIKIPKQSPKIFAEANTIALLLGNGYNGLLDESLFYSQKANSVSVSTTEWKDYFLINIWVEPSKGVSLKETKEYILSAFQKIESSDITEEMFQSVKNNQRLYLIKKKDDNEFRLNEISEAFLANWGYGKLQQKFLSINETKLEDLSEFVKNFVNQNIVSIETIPGPSNFVYITKPPISKLEFSKEEESKFKKDFSTEPDHSITPEFANFDLIESKVYPNGNQIIYQKNKENSLFKFKMIIEKGAWISPYLGIAIDYWKHLGTDLYTASALSTKFYLLGSSVSIESNGEALEIVMEGEDEQFISSFRLLEHSIKSVASSKEVWDQLLNNHLQYSELKKEEESEIDSALHNYSLFGKNSLRFFQANRTELEKFKSSDAIDLLGDLLKYRSKITYYGKLDFDTLENNVFREYTNLPKTIDPSLLSKKQYRTNPETTFYVLPRKRPHVELTYFSTVFLPSSVNLAHFSIYNSLYAGLSSPFFTTMREQTGNAYAADVFISMPEFEKEPVLWLANLSCQADKLTNCLYDAKNSIESPNITERRFAEAKISAFHSASTIRKSHSYLIDEFIRSSRLGLTEDLDKRMYESLNEIQWKDFIGFTKSITGASSFQISLIGDPKKFNRQSLKPLGRVEELNESAIIGR
ncbi:insulinase family protein [Leptospira mtsangambouensis]|uniref:Insulinase family protein n=1 Tax=Leptospira mtsangambouensis TaxID=2484912 RepID=A0ABY2P1T0_9LEPT|nr:insulinase family protein [Leptospira mtsangambouensis]